MNTAQIKERLDKAVKELVDVGYEFDNICRHVDITECYVKMFNHMPNILSSRLPKDPNSTDFVSIKGKETLNAIEAKYKDSCYRRYAYDSSSLFLDNVIISDNGSSIIYWTDDLAIPQEIVDCYVYSDKKDVRYIEYTICGEFGFTSTRMEVKKQECDLSLNYNEDLPDSLIKKFIESEDSGLIVLHGTPGCGKTSYLRYLIYNCKCNFIFIDSSCFNAITDASFIDFLKEHKNSVFVLEDCEKLLEDRKTGNEKISALLNLSDGIIGDGLQLKFICTFNADLRNLDKAILRKGRLRQKYEFKPLTSERTHKLAEKLGFTIPEGTSLPLCEIYNFDTNNGVKEQTKVIGF